MVDDARARPDIGTPDDPEQVDTWYANPHATPYVSFAADAPLGAQYRMKVAAWGENQQLQYMWKSRVEFWVGRFVGRLAVNVETGEDFWDCRIAWWCKRRTQRGLGYTVRLFDEQVELLKFDMPATFVRDCQCIDPGLSWWHYDDPTTVTLTRINAGNGNVPDLFGRTRKMIIEIVPGLTDYVEGHHNDHGPVCA